MSELPPLVELARQARRTADWASCLQLHTDEGREAPAAKTALAREIASLEEAIARVKEMLGNG